MKALINYYWTDDLYGDDLYKEIDGTPADIEDAIIHLEECGAEIIDVAYPDEEPDEGTITLTWHVYGRVWKTSMPSWLFEDAKKCNGVEFITSDDTGEILWMRPADNEWWEGA